MNSEYELKLTEKICELFRMKIKYLGQVVGGSRVRLDPSRAMALRNTPLPNSKMLQILLGLVNCYQVCISNMQKVNAPLKKIFLKNTKWVCPFSYFFFFLLKLLVVLVWCSTSLFFICRWSAKANSDK